MKIETVRGRNGEGGKQYRASILPPYPSPFSHLLPAAFCLLTLASLSACAIDERRSGLPSGAQQAIDRLTEHYAESRFAEIHAEASDEWRAAATADESRATLARARERLGRVVSRSMVRAAEQENASGELPGHTVSVNYNTKFERADAHEAITLVERGGRWQLARYTVNSDALKP